MMPSAGVNYIQTFRLSLARLTSRLKTINMYDCAFVAVLIAAALVRCYDISQPYCKIYESGFQEIIAKNHYYYSFTQTNFLSVVSVVNGENIYHLNHPPLLQILIALSYSLFGVHEWSARLVPILFSLSSIVLLYIIVQILFNKETALLASICASFMPMSAYFGRIVNFEAVVLFFVLLVVLGYVQWIETNKEKYYYLAVIGILLGGLVDWPFFLILPFLLGSSLLTGKKVRPTICLFLLGCSVAGGYLLLKSHILGYGQGVENWFSHLSHRSDFLSFIFIEEFYTRLTSRLLKNFSVVLLLLSFFGCIRSFRGIPLLKAIREKNVDNRTLIPFCLLLFGLSYLILFPQSTFVHEWQIFYLIPGISIYAGIGLRTMIHAVKGPRYVVAGSRICATTLLILFLMLSANTLISYHQGKDYNPQNIGLFIDSYSAPDDYICDVQVANPIMYYANRSNCQHILHPPDKDMIRQYNPPFVVFLRSESMDSGWSRSDFVEFLYEQQYTPLPLKSGVQVWARSADVLPLLYCETQSIELYNFSSQEKIEQLHDYQFAYTSYNADGRIILFEHPTSQGIVVVNYAVTIPPNASLAFSAGLDERAWSPEKGDGVTFEIYLNASGKRSLIFSRYIDPKSNISDRKWHEFTIPLHEYAGEDVTIGFATSPGPNRNNAYDWAYWINPRFTFSE
jgi:hypothetical protein